MNEEFNNNGSNVIQSAKKKSKKKFVIIFLAVVILVPILAWGASVIISINQITNPGKNNIKNTPLDNPVVMKVAESLPIPKITLVQVTPGPATPTQMPSDDGMNSESGQDADARDELSEAFDRGRSTYTNIDLGYSIDYPADYKAEENSYGLGVSQVNFISPNNNDPANYPDMQLLVYPSQIGKLIGQDFEKLYSLEENSTQKMSSETIDPRLFTVVEKKQIGGNRAFYFRTTDDPPDENIEAETGVYIYANDTVFILSTGESGKTLLDRMVLTFKMN